MNCTQGSKGAYILEWATHMLSGVVAGFAVTGGDWKGAIVGGIAGVIPDLDEPKSKFGKVFFFLSIPLSMVFKHRTFTHSLLFTLIIGSILFLFFDWWVGLAAMAGILAHIAGDMLTGKVQFLYPGKKWIGISIPPNSFVIIDRITGFLLVCILAVILIGKYFV